MGNFNVIKKDGSVVPFDITKIKEMIEFACEGLDVNPLLLESKLHISLKNNIKTSEIQQLLIMVCLELISPEEPDWVYVGGRLTVKLLHHEIYKNTKIEYEQFHKFLPYAINHKKYRSDIMDYYTQEDVESFSKLIDRTKDYGYSLAQVLSLKDKYLLKTKKGYIEYPQFSDMANAMILATVDKEDIREGLVKEFFTMINEEYISLATPFKANLRLEGGNTGSCFILNHGDSLAQIIKSWQDIAMISKQGGGVGLYLGYLRPSGSYSPKVVNSNKVNRWTKIINDIAIAVNQRGIRPGAVTPALDWWHLDIEDFIEMKAETGNGDLREKCFDLFPQVVVDSYFTKAVVENRDVYLFSQYELKESFGIDIVTKVDDELYKIHETVETLISEGKLKHFHKISAKYLWKEFLRIWFETGDFYITHKDNLNLSNYLKAHYVTNSANLCIESFSINAVPENWKTIGSKEGIETTETDGIYHSCNLVSIILSNIHTDKLLRRVCTNAVRMLDNSIDTGKMPVLEAKHSSEWLRNIGIGTLGTADWMAYNKLSYEKPADLDKLEALYERIAYYCYEASIDLAKEKGSYPMIYKADYSKLFGKTPEELSAQSLNGFDWVELAERIKVDGIRNFLLLAVAPNCQSGHNRMRTYDGIKSIYDILTEQGFDIDSIEKKSMEWIDLKTPIKVPTFEGDDYVYRIWNNGKQPTLKITFDDGEMYEYTFNHKLLVKRCGVDLWVKCKDLEIDDLVLGATDLL